MSKCLIGVVLLKLCMQVGFNFDQMVVVIFAVLRHSVRLISSPKIPNTISVDLLMRLWIRIWNS